MHPSPRDVGNAADRLNAWLEVAVCAGAEPTSDGQATLFVSDATGIPALWSVPTAGGPTRRVYGGRERIGAVFPSPTGRAGVLAVDRGGNEHWQLEYLADVGRPAKESAPLTHEPGVIHNGGGWRADGRRFVFTSNARDRRFFDVHELHLGAPAEPRLLHRHDGLCDVLDLRLDEVLIAHHTTNLDANLLILGSADPVVLNRHVGEVTVSSATLAADVVYAGSNPGRELCGLVRFRKGAPSHEFLREYDGDVEIVRASPDGEHLVVVVNRQGFSDTRVYTVATAEERPMNSGPRGVVLSVRWLPDSSGFVYAISSNDGVEVFRRVVATGKEKRLATSPRAVPQHLPAPRHARFRASDGVGIPYWEYAPVGGRAKGCIVWVHGGPESQARPGFVPTLEFLAAEGWRVVAPNVRGSTGYGRTFVHLDDVGRRPDSVRDLAELVARLEAEGKAARGRIGIVGGSYGGFMVLSAASRYPELWGAAVDIVGISNFVTFLQETGPWRRSLREAEYGSLERDRELLEALSPIHQADRIRAPLLVIHGRNDPRVPLHEAEQIVETLQRHGRVVELLVFDDEGHGIVRRPNRVTAWTRTVEFFERHLAG